MTAPLEDSLNEMASQSDESLGAGQREAIEFTLLLGHALNQCGYPAEDLKEILSAVSTRLGLPQVEIYTTATGLQMAFGPLSRQHTYLMSVKPGGLNLGRMMRLDSAAMAVMEQRLTPAAGSERVRAIQASASPYPALVTALAYAVASASFARVLGGGMREILVALLIGALTGLLAPFAQRSSRIEGVFAPVAAFIASFASGVIAATALPIASGLVTLAGLIVLLPGLALTISLEDLSTRHLVTGVGRLSAAMTTFLGIIFGVALGDQLAVKLAGPTRIILPETLPGWTLLVAVALSSLAAVVILRARPRDAGWMLLAVALAWEVSNLGGMISTQLGAFLGAFAVGMAGNLFSRWRNQPALLLQAPGLIILVPGSVGYQSLSALLEANALSGVEAGFKMFLIGAALVYGLLIANILTPRRGLSSLLAQVYRRVLGKDKNLA